MANRAKLNNKIHNSGALEKQRKKTITVFNKFIRLRDLKKNEETGAISGECIACKKIWNVGLYSDKSIINSEMWCASHYYLADRNESVMFDERNVNLSDYRCNKYLSGNLAPYKINLVEKIGQDEFDKLTEKRNQLRKHNIIELEELEKIYSDKVKIEAKRLGIKHY